MSNERQRSRPRRHRSDAGGVLATALDRVPDLESLLAMICECYGFAPADEDPADHPEHYWGCPAGEFLYWATRRPQAVVDWAARYVAGAAPPPPPR